MDGMKSQIKSMLQGIERYNPENIKTLEHYVDLQAREKGYDLLQKYFLYHFNYSNRTVQSAISFTKITYHTAKIFRFFKKTIVVQILLYMYSTIVNNSKKVIRIVFPSF